MGKITGRFVKVMLPGFHQRLFATGCFQEPAGGKIKRRATLKSRLGTWNVTKSARVNLPTDSVRSNDLGKKTSLILKDPGTKIRHLH